MTIKIREAMPSDVLQIARVHNKSAYEAYKDPKVMDQNFLKDFWSMKVLVNDWKDYFKESENNKNLISLVAVEGDRIVGILKANVADHHEKAIFDRLNVEANVDNLVHFKTIYIDPDHQGKGIGKKFMNHVAKMAVKSGKTKMMTLTAGNYEESPKFFKSFGASCVGEYNLDIKEHNGNNADHDGNIVCKVWVMDSREALEKSTFIEKDNAKNYSSVFKNKQIYYMHNDNKAQENKFVSMAAMKGINYGR